MPEVASIYSKLVLQAGQFHAELDRATDGLKKFAEQATHLTTGLAGAGGLGAILTGGGIIAGFAELARSGSDSIESQVKLAKQLGESVQGLSQLEHAAVVSNMSTEEFGRGLLILQRRLGGAENEASHAAVSFEKWGLNARELAAMPLTEKVEAIADRFNQMGSSAERSAMTFALFGKQGQKFNEMLSRGKDGIAALIAESDRLGNTLDENAIRKFEEAKQASNNLKEAWRGLSQEGSTLVSPLLVGLSNLATQSIQAFQEHARRAKQVFQEGHWTPKEGPPGEDPGERQKRQFDETLAQVNSVRDAINNALEKQIDVASGIDEWTKKFEEAYDAAWKLAREMDRMKPGSGDPLVAHAERLKENFEQQKAALKEAKELANDTKVDDERRRAARAQEVKAQEARVEEIEKLHDQFQNPAQKFRDELANLKQLKGAGLGADIANLKALDLIKGLGSDQHLMAGATMRGSAQDVHENNLAQMGEQNLNIQQIIQRRLEEANNLHKAQLDAAKQAADALQNLGLLN